MADFNDGMNDADGANETGGRPGAGNGSSQTHDRSLVNGQAAAAGQSAAASQSRANGQAAGNDRSGQAAGSMPQGDLAPGTQMPYVENPNGFGANYVNQPPEGAPGQPGMGGTNGVPNGGVPNGAAPNGQNPYVQYGPYGQYGVGGQPNNGQSNGGQPNGGQSSGGQPGQQYYGPGQASQQTGQPFAYGPYTSGPYAGQPGSQQNAQQGPYAGQQGQPGQTGPQYGQPYAYAPQPKPGQQPRNDWYAQFSRTDFDPFKLIEEHLPQQAKNWIRAVYAVVGVAALLIGIALLVWPGPTLVVATVALAIYFVISGIVRAVTAFAVQGVPAGWRVLDVVVGVLLTIGGVVMLKNTALSASTLLMLITSIVGISWIMEGVMSLAESWRVPSSGWAVAYGLISVFAGFVLLVTPMQSTVFLVIFAGCSLAVMGVMALVRAFTFGRAPKSR